ncbi:hypothetical protein BCD67_21365 [Oscillatoriales cyanobacterium USR001]|jgi:hypothetical protein|nr:hypothetical protein BCD67_21365 [Oscillatoriales cyanobacterium USR001]
MNIQVQQIQPTEDDKIFHVSVIIDDVTHQFTLTMKIVQIADRLIQIVNGDTHFLETFKFHQKIARQISQLISQTYNNEPIELPINLLEEPRVTETNKSLVINSAF